ncbi:FixJ family two-component response regulator [Novosphingobium chloroacetimidivorans]|uniref:FixJ family two-component response regulator n=1 Tax=Novosphingobium chloroacetimidivorans TaxID=1428314 RepID=A0A7W7KAP1_9SPHN|nr:response regulator [Novosphingobium chloroacetimidivorans]MBB4859301.1 FixJ family two-component response regulator [Novosphingobium chloroacetimidivorans]
MIEESSPATGIAPRLPAVDVDEPLIVIADDSADHRDAMMELFESVGIETMIFANARSLLESQLPDRPGCFILDVRMPGPSGLDLQAQLAGNGHLMPIIFVTGHGDVPMSIRAIKAGAFDFKTKPVRDQDLLDAAIAAIEADRARRAVDRVARESLEKFNSLSPREAQVLELLVGGLLNKQIAYELGVTEVTIKLHRGNVMKKMGVGSVAELVRMWDHVPASTRQGDVA